MKKIIIVVSCLLLVLLLVQTGAAQERKAGLTGAAFLKIGVGARQVAMGTATTAITGDVNQMFYNPAGIALKNEMLQASFTYNKWIADIGHNSAAVSYNLEDIGTIGIGFITFGISGIPADRDIPVDPVLKPFQIETLNSSTYDYRDMSYQLTFSRYVMDNLALGVTVRGVSESIDGLSTTAVALDFGSTYNIGVLDWVIAARFNNLGSDMKFYDIAFGLPLQFSIGTAIVPIKTGDSKIMMALDATKPQDGPLYLFGGVEYSFMNMLALRGGYKFNYSGTSETPGLGTLAVNSTIEGLSLGAGVQYELEGTGIIGVDYSYTQMNLLDNVHRFSVRFGMK
ncbi:PorV/PorQ family protein [bacterium]|nr:MAG: PorV/PorQ family protein [bacterium]